MYFSFFYSNNRYFSISFIKKHTRGLDRGWKITLASSLSEYRRTQSLKVYIVNLDRTTYNLINHREFSLCLYFNVGIVYSSVTLFYVFPIERNDFQQKHHYIAENLILI